MKLNKDTLERPEGQDPANIKVLVDEEELPAQLTDHVPVLHPVDALPTPQDSIPQFLNLTLLTNQQNQAQALYNFLNLDDLLLLQSNEGSTVYVAIVNVPEIFKVKVILYPGIGSSPIGITTLIA